MSAPAEPTLPDDILEEIFLRLDALADLARAAASCATFRRLITARAFLRRIYALHHRRRPLLGLLLKSEGTSPCEFVPAEPPHPSAPAARGVAQQADLAFSFLPAVPGGWLLRNVRGGLALLSTGDSPTPRGDFPDLVVCDPLHRRFVQIPPIPDDLAAAPIRSRCVLSFDYLLLREEDDSEDDSSSFRVVCRAIVAEGDAILFVFFSSAGTAGDGIWRSATLENCCRNSTKLFMSQCTDNRYVSWQFPLSCRLLMLDIHEMEFFYIFFFRRGPSSTAIGEVVEGRFRLFDLYDDKVEIFSYPIRASVYEQSGDDKRANLCEQCRHDKTIQLLPGYNWKFSKPAEYEVCLLLQAHLGDDASQFMPGTELQYFTLDLKTCLLEKLCSIKSDGTARSPQLELYTSFPMPLSLSSI
uniref:F-box domain-containing protein n=1 Tax=Leersia perrieri TaxID=77586 RepID=A0A0D9XHL5_9ORYZ